MSKGEFEEPQDDLDIEITELDAAEGNATPAARLPESTVFFFRRHKKPVTIATAAVFVLAILLILYNIAPIRQLFTPVAQQTTFSYRLDANPPWGHLFADGQAVTMTSSEFYPSFSLTRGKHTLLWRADPFSPQQCVIMVPVGSGIDTCKHPTIPPTSGGTDSYISFPTDMALLSTGQSAALLQATQAAFDSLQSSEMISAGDLYAQTAEADGPNSPACTVLQIAALCFVNASQPLKATLRLQLITNAGSRVSCSGGACASDGQNCSLFCDPFLYASPDVQVSSTLWQATVYVQLFWQFSTLDGRVVVDNQADTFIRGQQNDIAVVLNVTWDGRQWGVSIAMGGDYTFSSDPICDAAVGDLNNLENAVPAMNAQDAQTSINAIRGTSLADGCLIEFKLQTGGLATPTSSPPAYILQRFGVLLAVNGAAHTLFPFLPIASTYEKQLAQQWLTRQAMVRGVQTLITFR